MSVSSQEGVVAAATAKEPPRRALALLAALASLVLVTFMVLSTSRAAFTGTTDNPNNAWATGQVSLSDSRDGVAMFNVVDMVPGDEVSREIVVTNESSVASVDVWLYTAGLTGSPATGGVPDLAQYLDVTITSSGGGEYGPVTLAALAADHTDVGDGLLRWAAVAPGQTRTYTFVVELDEDRTPYDLFDASSQIQFVWEAVSNSTR
jgi:spore coat-associated protein N